MVKFGNELFDVALAGKNKCWFFKILFLLGICFPSLNIFLIVFSIEQGLFLRWNKFRQLFIDESENWILIKQS